MVVEIYNGIDAEKPEEIIFLGGENGKKDRGHLCY